MSSATKWFLHTFVLVILKFYTRKLLNTSEEEATTIKTKLTQQNNLKKIAYQKEQRKITAISSSNNKLFNYIQEICCNWLAYITYNAIEVIKFKCATMKIRKNCNIINVPRQKLEKNTCKVTTTSTALPKKWLLTKLLTTLLLLILLPISQAQNNTNERKIDLDCGGVFTARQFVIESPNYPSNYEPNLDCYYLLQGPECPHYYTFKFLDFSIENSLGCAKDRLSIDTQDAICNTTTGSREYLPKDGVLQLRFITNGEGSGRGFRILVTRSVCDYTTTLNPPTVAVTPRGDVVPKTLQPKPPHCCESSYNSKRFFLTSPGFPYSNSQKSDCVYNIYRTNNNICRLRIHFLFFWSGVYDQSGYCNQGYLQIDGRTICGCRVGLKLISPFDQRWGSSPKTFRFQNFGLPKSMFSGFALEVIQDECPNKYEPELTDSNSSIGNTFHYINDQLNKVAWPIGENHSRLEKAKEVSASSEVLEQGDWSKEQVVRHVYFFEPPDYDGDVEKVESAKNKEPEERSYVDTIDTLFPNGNDNLACRSWGVLQWTLLAKQMLWNHMPKCGGTAPDLTQKCKELNYAQGYFQSPGYPYYYPGNSHVCYRFIKKPGYCHINFHVLDFQLQESYECTGSHLLLGGVYRYCGSSLFNRKFTVDISKKPYEEVIFKSDIAYCARGFRAVYELVPCPQLPMETTTAIVPTNCNHLINRKSFTIDFVNPNIDLCTFNINAIEDACELRLTLNSFNLMCGSEYMSIKGRQYCGELSRKIVSVKFDENEKIEIIIKKTGYTMNYVKLYGEQVLCDELEVPAQRTIAVSSNDRSDSQEDYFSKNGTKPNSTDKFRERKYDEVSPTQSLLTVRINDRFGGAQEIPKSNSTERTPGKPRTDICGFVMNVTDTKHVCEMLKAEPEIEDCFQVTPHTIYVPYGNRNARLNLENKEVEFIPYEEITCEQSKQFNQTVLDHKTSD